MFVTGATGYIGRVVTERALAEGHAGYGMKQVMRIESTVTQCGELTSLDVLRQESAQAEAVLHWHIFTTSEWTTKRFCARGGGGCIGRALRGTEKAFVIGTAVVDPDPAGGETTEDSPLSQTFVLKDRIRSERHALRLSEDGVRVIRSASLCLRTRRQPCADADADGEPASPST